VDVDEEIGSLDADTNTNKALTVVGRWGESTAFCGSWENATFSSTNCVRYDSLGTEQTGASIRMQAPANASIALLAGGVGSAHGAYEVVLDPAPPHAPANVSGSARRAWLGAGNLLYFGSLDPARRYTITLKFTGTSDEVLEWGHAKFILAQG
jgi:hypothetical protein